MSTLFEPLRLGSLTLANRIVMAPMTRSRASSGARPSALAAAYYGQRASAGMIVTEGTHPSVSGQGYPRTPGIHDPDQLHAWRAVAAAVHDRGGRIFLQLMHAGRVAHPLNMAPGGEVVAPSALAADTLVYTDQRGFLPPPVPRALSAPEICSVIDDYAHAAGLAIDAGMDGVELHAGSGYLPMQFLSSSSNCRGDHYGGSAHNRCRFTVELVEAIAKVTGPDRIGVKISPGITFNDVHDDAPEETYGVLLERLSALAPAYIHVQRPARFLAQSMPGTDFSSDWVGFARSRFPGVLIAGGDYDFASAGSVIERSEADLIAFGRYFIANPDLPERFLYGAALADADPNTFYSEGAHGYTDYPCMNSNDIQESGPHVS